MSQVESNTPHPGVHHLLGKQPSLNSLKIRFEGKVWIVLPCAVVEVCVALHSHRCSKHIYIIWIVRKLTVRRIIMLS